MRKCAKRKRFDAMRKKAQPAGTSFGCSRATLMSALPRSIDPMSQTISRRRLLHLVGATAGSAAAYQAAVGLGVMSDAKAIERPDLVPVAHGARRVLILGAGIAGLTARWCRRAIRHRRDCRCGQHHPAQEPVRRRLALGGGGYLDGGGDTGNLSANIGLGARQGSFLNIT